MSETWAFGIHIEGIGETESSGNKGILWGYGEPDTSIPDYDFKDVLQRSVNSISDSFDKKSGAPNTSAFTFKMENTSVVRDNLLQTVLQPTSNTGADIPNPDRAGSSTVNLGTTGLSGTVFVGGETMRITGDNGDNTYTVEREFWDSFGEFFPSGSPVWTKPPFYKFRRAKLFVWDDDTLHLKATMLLKGPPRESDPGMLNWTFEGVGQLGAIKGVERNKQPQKLDTRYEVVGFENSPAARIVTPLEDSAFFDSVVEKGSASAGTDLTDPSKMVFIQCDGAIVPYVEAVWKSKHPGNTVKQDGTILESPVRLIEGNEFQTDGSAGESETVDVETWELAYWNRDLGKAPYDVSEMSTATGGYPWHPMGIGAALMCSTDDSITDPSRFDMLDGNIGAAMRWIFADDYETQVKNLIEDTREIRIDQLVLGWDGEPFNPVNTALFRLGTNYGFIHGVDDEGLVYPTTFEQITVENFDEALNNTITILPAGDEIPDIRWIPGQSQQIQSYTALVGGTPVKKAKKIEGNSFSSSSRIDRMTDPEGTEWDFSTLKTTREATVRSFIQRQASLLRIAVPRIKFRANDSIITGKNLGIGDFATVQLPGGMDSMFIDGAGIEVTNSDLLTSEFAGQITSRSYNPFEGSYELEMSLTLYGRTLPRYRTPNLRVASTGSDGVGFFVASETDPVFSTIDRDEQQFTVGQQIKLLNPDLSVKSSEVKTVDTIDSGKLYPSSDWTEGAAAGDIITLANYDDFTFTEFGGERGHAYLADTADNLGTSDDDADVWA